MSIIFISYRRQDGISYALPSIKKRLEAEFGAGSVFFDLDITLGTNFADHIRQHVMESRIVLAFMGENWAGVASDGSRRIDEEGDFVRIEIALALDQKKIVVPIFTGSATPRLLEGLPSCLADLKFINGLELRSGPSHEHQFTELVRRLRLIAPSADTRVEKPPVPAAADSSLPPVGRAPVAIPLYSPLDQEAPSIASPPVPIGDHDRQGMPGLVLVFNVAKGMKRGRSAYDATRGWWRGTEKWEHARLAVGLAQRRPVCVVEIERWMTREEDAKARGFAGAPPDLLAGKDWEIEKMRRGFVGRPFTAASSHELLGTDFGDILSAAAGYWGFGGWLAVEFTANGPVVRKGLKGQA